MGITCEAGNIYNLAIPLIIELSETMIKELLLK